MILSLLTLCSNIYASDPADLPPPKQAVVVAVYDGDTFTLDTGQKVRLRGVNTPELRPPEEYGLEARDAAARLLLNQKVTLTYGPVTKDGYGRLIASVQVKETDIATHLLEQGLGHIFIIPPDTMELTLMTSAQAHAKGANRGIWSTERYSGKIHITSFHANAPGDDSNFVNGEYLRVCNVSQEPLDVSGYRITDINGRSYDFPSMLIPPGHTVKVHSGRGRHQADPKEQLEIYLGSSMPIWNNTHDLASIYNGFGQLEDRREHAPKSAPRR